jgi:hypothetical protein
MTDKIQRLMEEHKRLLENTSLGAWDIYYTLSKFVDKDEKMREPSKAELLLSFYQRHK